MFSISKRITATLPYILMGVMFATSVLTLLRPTLAFSSADFDSLIEGATEAGNNVSEGLYKIAMVGGPIALIIVFGIIMFSHDSRKVSMLIGIGITILIAWLAIIIVHNGYIKDFLESIGNKYFKGSGGA